MGEARVNVTLRKRKIRTGKMTSCVPAGNVSEPRLGEGGGIDQTATRLNYPIRSSSPSQQRLIIILDINVLICQVATSKTEMRLDKGACVKCLDDVTIQGSHATAGGVL